MFRMRIASLVRAFLLILLAAFTLELAMPLKADARAGGGRRSMGRSYSRPAPAQQYRPQSAPPPSGAQPPRSGGGFARGLAGGIAGGFLGSMLFSSMGHAAGGPGGMGGGGGIGLIEIILIAGLAFVAFRWWKSRQMKLGAAGQGAGSSFAGGYPAQGSSVQDTGSYPSAPYADQNAFISSSTSITSDEASDLFFKVQGAFTRRDLSSVGDILGQDMYQVLNQDIRDLKERKQINRLENISVRKVDILDRWNEQAAEFAKVRFTANLLDYTVDETTNSVVSGSASDPVKFEEDWPFCRQTAYASWQLVGIEQV